MSESLRIVIAGGGLTGRSLALALLNRGYQVVVVDRRPLELTPQADGRALALSLATCQALHALGLWSALYSKITPITDIHVSERGGWGFSRLAAKKYGHTAFGGVVDYEHLLCALGSALAEHDRRAALEWRQGECLAVDQSDDRLSLELACGDLLHGSALVVAEGGMSATRESLGIEEQVYNYEQTAIVTTVTVDKPIAGKAFERFTSSGPLALLPFGDKEYALVWSLTPEIAAEAMVLDDESFRQALQKAFGYRLGRLIGVDARHAFPLVRRSCGEIYKGRVVLAGNACHTLHPIAGQGFNLAMRDVALLDELLGRETGLANWSGLAQEYALLRTADHQSLLNATHGLATLHTLSCDAAFYARNKALAMFDVIPLAKTGLVNYAMGFRAPTPQLIRSYSGDLFA